MKMANEYKVHKGLYFGKTQFWVMKNGKYINVFRTKKLAEKFIIKDKKSYWSRK